MKRNAVHCGQSVFLCSRPPRRRPRWQPLDRLVSSPISPGSVCFPAAAIQLLTRIALLRRAKARWVRVFPPAGNRKKQRQRSLLLCTPARPQRSARSPAVFARVGLLTDAFRGYPQRARPAFSPRHYSSSNDPLSQHASPRANKRSAITATKPKACRLRSHVRDLHPIPLFSRTRSACPDLPGSRSCH